MPPNVMAAMFTAGFLVGALIGWQLVARYGRPWIVRYYQWRYRRK